MTFYKAEGRQNVSSVVVGGLTLADLESGVAKAIAEMPYDAVVIGGFLTVVTPFDSTTSDLADLGDETTGDRYLSGVDVAAAAGTTYEFVAASIGHKYDGIEDLTFTWTGSGGNETEGEVRVVLNYVRTGRADHTQG